jgi:hypothetical protein
LTREQLTRFLAEIPAVGPRLVWPSLLPARTGLRLNEALVRRVSDLNLDPHVERDRRAIATDTG